MTKLLLVIAFIVGVVLWIKYLAGGRGQIRDDKKAQPPVEDMVRCKICGVNLPRSEALLSQGKIYCCDEHRQRDA